MIIAGAFDALAALAQALNAPVCSTVRGLGSLAADHALNVGVVGSNGGVPATQAVVAQADLVLFIGCRAGSTSTEHWKFPPRGVSILHIDVDAMTIATNYRTDVALVGDALLALAAPHQAVLARAGRRPADAVDGRALVARARRDKQVSPRRLRRHSKNRSGPSGWSTR